MLNKCRKFVLLPWSRKLLWLEAIFWLGLSRYRVKHMDFRKWSINLGIQMAQVPSGELSEQDQSRVTDISWAVRSAAEHVPWEAVCLPQAMAAKAMLCRRNIPCVLYLGMRKGETNPYDAHAWVKVNGIPVTGGESPEYVVVSYFV